MIDQSSKINGTHANARSFRVASSCLSKRKIYLIVSIMEMTLVEAELTINPSVARDWPDVVGWNSSKVSTASDKLCSDDIEGNKEPLEAIED